MKTEKENKKKKMRSCKECGDYIAQERRTYPYETEIYENYEIKYNCCEKCKEDCAWEV